MDHLSRLVLDSARRHVPLDVSVEITHHCNFRCQHCYIPDFDAPDLLTTERLLDLWHELVEMGTLFLTLTGGEMFLRKDWIVLAREARRLGFGLRLFTNGATVNEAIADRMVDLDATVEISLYSTDEQTFENITRRPGSFRKTLRGLGLLLDRGIEVQLKSPVMTLNASDIDAVADFARRHGCDFRTDPKIAADKDGGCGPTALRVPHDRLVDHYRAPYSGCFLPPGDGGRDDMPLCAAGNRYAVITSSGDVMACNILPGSAGNLRERSFREIWEGSPWLRRLRGIRQRDLNGCDTCDKLSYCGRCFAETLVVDGDLMSNSAWSCERAATLEVSLRPSPDDLVGVDGRCRRCGGTSWHISPEGRKSCWDCAPPSCAGCGETVRRREHEVRWRHGRPTYSHPACRREPLVQIGVPSRGRGVEGSDPGGSSVPSSTPISEPSPPWPPSPGRERGARGEREQLDRPSTGKEIGMLRIALRIWTVLVLATATFTVAQGPRGGDFGTLNPDAPPETAQFAFLVGEWDCVTRFRKPDGSGYEEGQAKWIGYFILDGWAIEDDWISTRPDGKPSYGLNIRSFDPRTGKWDNRWLAAWSLQWKTFEAEKKGDSMVMIGGRGRDPRGAFVDRNIFSEISENSWKWRKDRSYDGGATWIEGIGFIDATRAAASSHLSQEPERPQGLGRDDGEDAAEHGTDDATGDDVAAGEEQTPDR